VNLDVIKPWITRAVIDLLGFEDEVVIDYAFSLLEENTSVLSCSGRLLLIGSLIRRRCNLI
jgi:PWI domain